MPINKCAHGVYVPQGEERAPYCQVCTPGGPANTQPVVLPRSSADSLSNAGRVMANKRSSTGGCPECRSAIYMRVSEEGGDAKRECADCSFLYSVRLSTHQRAVLMEAEEEQ